MRYLIAFLFLFFLSPCAHGQQFLMRGPDSAGHFVFRGFHDGQTSVSIGSYDILRGQSVGFMTHWSLSRDGSCYWTNGENIYRFDFASQKSKLVSPSWHDILEFCVRDSFAYIVYNPSKMEGPFDNRYSPGIHFCCLNLKSGHREEFHLPRRYNFTNLSVSPGRRWAVFINTIFTRKADEKEYQLVLFDLKTGALKVIGSGFTSKYQWFGNDDQYNSSLWPDDSTLLYYKNTNGDENGSIFCYHTRSAKITVALKQVPQRDFSWFGFYQNAFYFSDRSGLYKTATGKDKQVITGDKKIKVRQGVCYP